MLAVIVGFGFLADYLGIELDIRIISRIKQITSYAAFIVSIDT